MIDKKKYPKVSIITITYNLINAGRKAYFLQMVDSVKSQTYSNIEHIVIDGASDDGTVELIKSTGLKYISEPDSGIYDAMNKGIMLASGKYICFMNSDDYFNTENAVKYSVETLEKARVDFSYATATVINKEEKFLYNIIPNIYGVFSRMPFCHQTMFVKLDVLKKEAMFNANLKSAADYDLIIRLMLKKYKYAEVKYNIVTYRLIGESYINFTTSIKEQFSIYKNLYSQYVFLSEQEYLRILIEDYIPIKLLFALGVYDFHFYKNYIKRKQFISFKFSFRNGLEYLIVFNKVLYDKNKILNKNLSLETFLEQAKNRYCKETK